MDDAVILGYQCFVAFNHGGHLLALIGMNDKHDLVMTHVISLRFKGSLPPCGAADKVEKRGIIAAFGGKGKSAVFFEQAGGEEVGFFGAFAAVDADVFADAAAAGEDFAGGDEGEREVVV